MDKKYEMLQDLTADDVLYLCRANNLYTCGDSEAYYRMLTRVSELNKGSKGKWDIDAYVEIATDIAEHSRLGDLEGDEKMENIAYLLMKATRRWIRATD